VSPELEAALNRAREWERNASPEERAAMIRAQRASWARAFAPCEHGDPDWETCPKCIDAALNQKGVEG
jgi:hypothetical protein